MGGYTAPEIVLIIAALGAVIVQTITSLRISTKVSVIEGHVNSRESKLSQQILGLERENTLLMSVINQKDQTAAVLASSVAVTLPSTPIPIAIVSGKLSDEESSS